MIEEKFKKHLQHTRSSVEGKKPTADNLLFGEIAVNYNADNEFLAIKNSEGEIVTFPRNIGSAQTRESVDEEAKQGIVALDDFLDFGFTSVNPVTNRILSKTIMENEEVVAAALNDLNIRIDESYQKPLAGIPKSDLDLSIQESLSKADTALQGETDPIFMASAAQGITNEDIDNWNGKTEKVIIDVNANGINDSYIDVEDTSLYQSVHSAIQEGKVVFLRLTNNDLYPFILRLISCPPQTMTYDFATTFSAGLVDNGRVNSAYASVAPEGYTLHCGVNYFYKKPNNGVPKSDLAQSVQASLDKADSSVQTTGGTVNGTLKVTTISAATYQNLPLASSSTTGVMRVGNGINVSNGTISLKAGTNISIGSDNSINCTVDVTPDLTGVVMKTGSTMTGKLSVNNGGLDVTGDTKVNGTLSATSISSPNLSISNVSGTTVKGASISGTSVSGGTISGTTIKGASISGTSVSGGTLSGTTIKGATVSATTYTNLPTATTTSFGVIRVGNGLSVTNGVVSVTSLDGSYVNTTGDTMSGKLSVTNGGIAVSGASTFNSSLTAATVNATNISGTTVKGSTISATTYSNLPTASTTALGMMKVGNGLSVTNGEVSVNSLDGKYVNVSGDTMTGKLSVTSGGIAVSGASTFNGTVTAATVNATNISGTTVKGSTISGATASLTGNLTVGGDINATGAMYSSDKRLKENIGNISNEDLEKVSNVDIVKFNFKSDESKRTKYGVIAQDIENIGFSNLVGENIDGTKNVDYISLLMLEIEYLKKEIKDLKAKLG